MTKRGLIVGKFYPPHRGHKYLIDSGRSQVDELTVIICQKPHERPAGELRAAWLREIHPDVRVLLIDDIYDENDSQIWAENCIRWLGFAPDVVFSSEDYGDRFAHYLGCGHVSIDRSRTVFPISGTKVRSAPLQHWQYIEPPVRGWYAKRICLVGAESTGKTTLAKALAAHYLTSWVREYGREYSERKHTGAAGYNWTSDEFEQIAKVQCDRENAAARHANKILICDTDAFATGIWHRRYLQFPSQDVAAIVDRQKPPDLYLLTDVKTPFVQDGTRDGKAIRNWMHETFIAELTAHNRSFQSISGSPQQRLKKAIAIIDRL
ncbi:AAA family ATPase [Chamaesiphon minutus]|uniref:Cytidyltransferase-related enzyme n=1 Tax=Chamaesiphon minutus (strain ATCC 27169 / PCC 6605) TaxID=1173020 RepID=K9UB62_CHAP6|nr:AAA family ATPase [Chamaesiphon minutus]AFY92322.1 cytidyltransferase-related enzyme [Chamaesiphon minutus PCC 6605]